MLLMVHGNPARLEGGMLHVDRKFHTGMQEYLSRLPFPLTSVHPHLPAAQDHTVMDLVQVPASELGYDVKTFNGGAAPRRGDGAAIAELRDLVKNSRVVYGGGRLLSGLAKQANIPSVAVLEYNLRTMMTFAVKRELPLLRRTYSKARVANYYLQEVVPAMRRATIMHCNGYPVYQESRYFGKHRLLYLDSRMRAEMLIAREDLERRLVARQNRPPKLIFSGRFEPQKGALDVVLTARDCMRAGLRFTLDLYGQGSQRQAMLDAVAQHGLRDFVTIHDPVPYPELVTLTKDCDLFVCCHVQDDPSCTYLETLGCGVPIAGYGNAMWAAMCEDSKAGVVAPISDTVGLAKAVARICGNPVGLEALSRRALAFAEAHTFELEFSRRTDSLLEVMARGRS